VRTTALDCIKLAWFLFRYRKGRKHLRIGQLLCYVTTRPSLFYVENATLLSNLRSMGRKGK
jgi:hypothetical protein